MIDEYLLTTRTLPLPENLKPFVSWLQRKLVFLQIRLMPNITQYLIIPLYNLTIFVPILPILQRLVISHQGIHHQFSHKPILIETRGTSKQNQELNQELTDQVEMHSKNWNWKDIWSRHFYNTTDCRFVIIRLWIILHFKFWTFCFNVPMFVTAINLYVFCCSWFWSILFLNLPLISTPSYVEQGHTSLQLVPHFLTLALSASIL